MGQNNPLQNNFNNTGFSEYTQNNFSSNTNYTTTEQSDYPNYFFAAGDNGTQTSSIYERQSEQPVFSFTNNETQSLSYMSQQYTDQNITKQSESDCPDYFFQTGNNITSAPHTTRNYEQQQSEQSVFLFTNNEMPHMPQQYTDQNPLNTMIGSSQANNTESVFNFEIPGFKIKITVVPTSLFANSNAFENNSDNSQTQFLNNFSG